MSAALSLLAAAAILAQTGGNHISGTELPGSPEFYRPSCSQPDWVSLELGLDNPKKGSFTWSTEIPATSGERGVIEGNLKKALRESQRQLPPDQELTPKEVIDILQAGIESFCNYKNACRGRKDCRFTEDATVHLHGYSDSKPNTRSEKPAKFFNDRGRR